MWKALEGCIKGLRIFRMQRSLRIWKMNKQYRSSTKVNNVLWIHERKWRSSSSTVELYPHGLCKRWKVFWDTVVPDRHWYFPDWVPEFHLLHKNKEYSVSNSTPSVRNCIYLNNFVTCSLITLIFLHTQQLSKIKRDSK